jgi:hypothetical protein
LILRLLLGRQIIRGEACFKSFGFRFNRLETVAVDLHLSLLQDFFRLLKHQCAVGFQRIQFELDFIFVGRVLLLETSVQLNHDPTLRLLVASIQLQHILLLFV